MSRLVRELARACREHPFEEKWLLASSLRIGWQWLESAARAGQPALNVRVQTPLSIALALASPELAARGLAVASGRAADFLVEETLDALREEGLRYLGSVEGGLELVRVVRGAIDAVRGAGLGPRDLDPGRFEVHGKGEDLRRILAGYLERLRSEGLVDGADLLGMARRAVAERGGAGGAGKGVEAFAGDSPGGFGPDILLLVPADLDLSLLERRMLEAIPADRRLTLPVDEPGVRPGRDGEAGAGRGAEGAVGGVKGTIRMMRAVGEVNEVRAVLRHCQERRIAWDEVEILHTDSDVYVPLILETVLALEESRPTAVGRSAAGLEDGTGEGARTDDTPDRHIAGPPPGASLDAELPVTFREGIPCRYARAGRALIGWIRWIVEDFPQAALVAMIREGLLEIPGEEGAAGETTGGTARSGFGRLAALLRGVGIGFGRARYLPKIEARIAALTHRLEGTEGGAEARGEEETSPARRAAIERDLCDLRALRALVSLLFGCVPRRGATRGQVVECARRFLDTAARSVGRLDAYARRKLLDELEEMGYWFSRGAGRPGGGAWKWIEDLAAGARVLGSGPRPGCLHVDGIDRGGHSGRPFTFILGLDDARFPGAGIPDPLLLDRERRRLSEEIPRAVDRLERRIDGFARLLARLRGTVTLSHPGRDLVEDRDRFPAPVLLSVFRTLTGDPEGDPRAFSRWLPPALSFAPEGPEACLDMEDWWLWRMAGPDPVEDADRLLLGRHPHLAAGREAAAARRSDRFTPWDGHVPEAGPDLDPTADAGPVMSANRFETLGRCPLRWFFEYGLEIAPPDEMTIDITRWLDRPTGGSLLHEVFEAFLREILEEGRGEDPRRAERGLIDPGRDAGRLGRLLEDRIRIYADRYPPPSESVYRAEVRELERTARLFLAEEARHLRESGRVPRFLEASMGMPPGGPGSALDSGEPVAVPLPGGMTIRARGRIDRVDEVVGGGAAGGAQGDGGTGRYVILDYKTGSDYAYERGDPFRGGRRAQPWLYVEMARRALRERASPGARVERFGYFFPGARAAGARYEWSVEELSDGGAIVESLCRLVAAGAFPATDDAEADCTFCDYRSICGEVEAVAAASAMKMDEPGNAVLEPFRRLRRGDRGDVEGEGGR